MTKPHRVTNAKLSAVTDTGVTWAPHAGFTLLFDNPDATAGGVQPDGLLACRRGAHAAQGLYGALEAWLDAQDADALRAEFGFCAMPPSTWHVTAWDGLNVAVLGQALPAVQPAMQRWFDTLPTAVRADPSVRTQLEDTRRALEALLPISFAYDALRSSTGVGLVADLRPADAAQAERFAAFQAARRARALDHARPWGWAYTTPLEPHITLGYYPNPDCGRAAEGQLQRWDAALRERLAGHRLTVDRIGVYGFTDMVRFYRA